MSFDPDTSQRNGGTSTRNDPEDTPVDVMHVRLTKAQFAAMAPLDRSLFLLLGHVTNELNVLSKTMLAMTRPGGQPRDVLLVEHGQALIMVRLLVGKLHEAWELFKRRVLVSKEISSAYLPGMSARAKQSLVELKVHFGEGSPLTQIRHKLAFHSCDQDNLLDESFKALPETEPWTFYLGEQHANTFYYASELVMTKAAADLAGGFNQLFDIVANVTGAQLVLFGELMAAIAEKHLALCGPMLLVKSPSLKSVRLPFFVRTTE